MMNGVLGDIKAKKTLPTLLTTFSCLDQQFSPWCNIPPDHSPFIYSVTSFYQYSLRMISDSIVTMVTGQITFYSITNSWPEQVIICYNIYKDCSSE